MSDILERAKEAASIEYAPDISYDDWRGLVRELIAEAESSRALMRSSEESYKNMLRRLGDFLEESGNLIEYPLVIQSAISAIKSKDARIKELEAEIEALNGLGTVGYLIGYREGGDGNKVLVEYIKRLEAAFLSAVEDAGLNPRRAREALERIKEGTDET